MKYLIPYLQDDQKAADYLRQLRWPNGVTCPRCGGDAVESRERCDNGLQRFNCVPCAVRLGGFYRLSKSFARREMQIYATASFPSFHKWNSGVFLQPQRLGSGLQASGAALAGLRLLPPEVRPPMRTARQQ